MGASSTSTGSSQPQDLSVVASEGPQAEAPQMGGVVAPPSPETLKWRTHAVTRLPQPPPPVRREAAAWIRAQEFGSVKNFDSVPPRDLIEDRPAWRLPGGESPPSDEVWGVVMLVHRAPDRTTSVEARSAAPSTARGTHRPGTAEPIVRGLESSIRLRSTDVLRSMLGLPPGAQLPTPYTIMRTLLNSPAYQQLKESGHADTLLTGIMELRTFESLVPGSRISYRSGINSWILFCELKGILPDNQLEVSE